MVRPLLPPQKPEKIQVSTSNSNNLWGRELDILLFEKTRV